MCHYSGSTGSSRKGVTQAGGGTQPTFDRKGNAPVKLVAIQSSSRGTTAEALFASSKEVTLQTWVKGGQKKPEKSFNFDDGVFAPKQILKVVY